MKTLQKQFTTTEQSKLLLELGMPANSADFCYEAVYDKNYDKSGSPSGWRPVVHSIFIGIPDWSKHSEYPCWSAGRLIEIYEICTFSEYDRDCARDLMDDIIFHIQRDLDYGFFDFSKLKEYL